MRNPLANLRGTLVSLSGAVASLRRRGTIGNSVAETTVANLVITVLGVLTGVLSARLLGPQGRGELAVIQLWPSQIATFAMLGLDAALVFYASREPDRVRRYLASSLALIGVGGTLLVAGGVAVLPRLLLAQSDQAIAAAQVFLCGIAVAYALGGMPHQALRAIGAWRAWNALRLVVPVGWALVLLAASPARDAVDAVALSRAWLAVYGVWACCAMWTSRRLLPAGTGVPARADVLPLLRFGVPNVLAALPHSMNLRLDQLVLATLLGPRELGLYVAAVAWGSATTPVLSAVGPVLFPRLSAMTSADERRGLITKTLLGFGAVSAISAIASLSLAHLGIPWLFGEAFRAAVPAAAVLVVANVFSVNNGLLEDILRGLGRPRAVFVSQTVGLATTVVLLALLVRTYGIVGAALASLGAYATATVCLAWWLRQSIVRR